MAEHPITLRLDDRTWWKLATVAEQRETTIAALIEEKLAELRPVLGVAPRIRTKSRGDEVREQVAELHALGLNDREIADVMHCQPATIQHHRALLRLPSNYRRSA